jgi:hypothetical protein
MLAKDVEHVGSKEVTLMWSTESGTVDLGHLAVLHYAR